MREPRQNPVAAFMEDKDKVTVGVSVLGAFITVIGLVFLAVQAFSRGWLGPGAAVSGAAVLCLLLIAGSFVVHTRSTDGPTAPALMCVGVLGMFTDLWVLVFGLEWLSPGVGVVLVGAIFAAGLLTAWSWSHQVLAVTLLVAGCGFLTPAVIYLLDVTATSRFESLSLVVLGLLGAATTWHRDWRGAAVASAAVFLLGSLVLNVDGKHIALAASAAVGIVVMAWLSRSEPAQTPGISAVTRWVPVSLVPVLLLLSNEQSDLGMTATTVACLVLAGAGTAFAGAGAVASSVSLRPGPGEDGPSAAAALRAALCCGVAGIVAVSLVRQQDLYASPSLWWMIALVAVATTAALQADQLPVSLVWVVFLVTVAYSLPRVAPAWVETSASPILMWPVLLLLALPGVLILRGAASLGATRETSLILAAVLLVVVSSAIPLVFMTVSDTDVVFMAGHLVTSVTWMGLGVAMLARDNGPVGLALALLASAKLVFYDLSALAGLIQVAAFIICGAILLAAAILRERRREGP